MTLSAKWMGVDMGECLMDVTARHAHLLAGDTAKILGRPEMSATCSHRWRVLMERYGSVPIVLERHKRELLNYVFDADPHAARVYSDVEQSYLAPAVGAHEALTYLRRQGIELSIVTAARSGLGPLDESTEFRFLERHGLLKYFESLVTPRGRLWIADRSVDPRYEGTSKEDGTIYARLSEDLGIRGIAPREMVMMGDRELTDIRPAKKHGLKTILYTGYSCGGPTEADMVIDSFRALIGAVMNCHGSSDLGSQAADRVPSGYAQLATGKAAKTAAGGSTGQ